MTWHSPRNSRSVEASTSAQPPSSDAAAPYFQNHTRRDKFPWSLYHKDLERRVARALAHQGAAPRVLVVGCGLEPFVPGGPERAEYSGCDVDARAITRCRELYPHMAERLHVCPDGYTLFDAPIPAPFDVVVAKEVIEHTLEPERWARALCAVIRPGGALILTTPNYSRLSTLGLLERTVLEWVARRDGYSRSDIHPSRFNPRTLRALDLGVDMQLLNVEVTWNNWALVGLWKRREGARD